MDKYSEIRVPISHHNPSIRRNEKKCVLCGKCKDVCKKQMGVAGYFVYDDLDPICINCGQCANVCPVDAITEQDDTTQVLSAIDNPDKTVVFITSPAVRVAIGEMFGLSAGEFVAGKMVSALKKLGANYVFDVAFGADLTVMEEATELIDRIKANVNLPQFTSCCPAWVKFVETFYPQYIPNLSSCKSPIAMQASVIKNYFAKSKKLDAKDIYLVALTPCVAKKFEAKRPELTDFYGQDTDCVITVRELAKLIKNKKINFNKLKDKEFDKPFLGSGAGVIFGASGGVLEATVRTAYYLTTNNNPPKDLLNFNKLRGYKSVKTATVELCGKQVKLCVVFGTMEARKLLEKLPRKNFDMIEVMACPNGCVGGGGQPKAEDIKQAVINRGKGLFSYDQAMLDCRASYQNPAIKQIYDEFIKKPNSEQANKYLHTTFIKR